MIDKYTNIHIDSDGEEEDRELGTGQSSRNNAPNMISGQRVIHLNKKVIPRDIFSPLERFFYLNYVPLKPFRNTELSKAEDRNQGTQK